MIAIEESRDLHDDYKERCLQAAKTYLMKQARNRAKAEKHRLIKEVSKCEICGLGIVPILQVHHILPVSRRGNSNKNNMIVVCPNCHNMLHVLYRNFGEKNDDMVCKEVLSKVSPIIGEKMLHILACYFDKELVNDIIENF